MRSARLRKLSENDAVGRSIGDYLRLMADLADAQQAAVGGVGSAAPDGDQIAQGLTFSAPPDAQKISQARTFSTLPGAEQLAQARAFRMPLVSAAAWPREARWRLALTLICDSLIALPGLSAPVRAVCDRLRSLEPEQIEAQANAVLAAQTSVEVHTSAVPATQTSAVEAQTDALLATQNPAVDAATAPFLMAALQVYWVDLASHLRIEDIPDLGIPGSCPTCGTLPVASIVRTDSKSQGFRYLHCALCATEWHMVRVKCSQCQSTKGISYQSIENGPRGIRAECCDTCRAYRKILYQEEDAGAEPVADDLASVTLDLLLSEAGYHRASPNPLLW